MLKNDVITLVTSSEQDIDYLTNLNKETAINDGFLDMNFIEEIRKDFGESDDIREIREINEMNENNENNEINDFKTKKGSENCKGGLETVKEREGNCVEEMKGKEDVRNEEEDRVILRGSKKVEGSENLSENQEENERKNDRKKRRKRNKKRKKNSKNRFYSKDLTVVLLETFSIMDYKRSGEDINSNNFNSQYPTSPNIQNINSFLQQDINILLQQQSSNNINNNIIHTTNNIANETPSNYIYDINNVLNTNILSSSPLYLSPQNIFVPPLYHIQKPQISLENAGNLPDSTVQLATYPTLVPTVYQTTYIENGTLYDNVLENEQLVDYKSEIRRKFEEHEDRVEKILNYNNLQNYNNEDVDVNWTPDKIFDKNSSKCPFCQIAPIISANWSIFCACGCFKCKCKISKNSKGDEIEAEIEYISEKMREKIEYNCCEEPKIKLEKEEIDGNVEYNFKCVNCKNA